LRGGDAGLDLFEDEGLLGMSIGNCAGVAELFGTAPEPGLLISLQDLYQPLVAGSASEITSDAKTGSCSPPSRAGRTNAPSFAIRRQAESWFG
jgi:hypothetical protein